MSYCTHDKKISKKENNKYKLKTSLHQLDKTLAIVSIEWNNNR